MLDGVLSDGANVRQGDGRHRRWHSYPQAPYTGFLLDLTPTLKPGRDGHSGSVTLNHGNIVIFFPTIAGKSYI